MSTISAAAITDAGYAALVNALATGGKIFPQTAKVSASPHEITRELTALTDPWWEGDITLVSVIDENTFEARVVVPPDQAVGYMRTVALYLNDGTLFAVSAAKDLPPGAGQELIIQLSYNDIVALTDFQYLSYEDWENQLEIMDKFSQLGNAILENAEAIGLLEGKIEGCEDNADDIDTLENQVSDNIQDINLLDGRVIQNETDIASLSIQVAGNDTGLGALTTQVSTNTGNISTLDSRVTQNETNISDLNTQVTENSSDISSINSQLTANTGNISALDGRVTQNETNISNLNTQVAGNDSDISSLNSQVTTNTGNINALDGRVTQNETDIDALQNATLPQATIGGQTVLLGLKKVIDQDITLTCTPESSGADFCGDDALAQALAALEPYEISGNVNIQLAEGMYGAVTPMQTLVLTHKDISRITIVGNMTDGLSTHLTAEPDVASKLFTIWNANGALTAADFAPGGNFKDFTIGLRASNSNDGLYTVDSATDSGNNILVTVKEPLHEHIDWPQVCGLVYLMPANRHQLIFADDQTGFYRNVLPGRVRILGVSLWGNQIDENTKAFHARGSGVTLQLHHVICNGFNNGVFIESNATGEMFGQSTEAGVYVKGGSYGFLSLYGGSLLAPKCIASGATVSGFHSKTGSMLTAYDSLAGNCNHGFTSEFADLSAISSTAMNNGTGYHAYAGRIWRDSCHLIGNTSDYYPAGTPPVGGSEGGWIL